MGRLIARQPVVSIGASITVIVPAAIALVNAFWPGTVTDAQRDALLAFIVCMWPVLAIIWSRVTPVAAPRLPEGSGVLLPDGTQGRVTRA